VTLPKLPAADAALKLRALWVLTIVLAALAAGQTWTLVHLQPLGVDFLPLWTAGRMAASDPGHVYDFAVISRAQSWLLPDFQWMRPYAYPPTALLALAPLGALPFWWALALWTGASFAVFAVALERLARGSTALALGLGILSPAVMLAAIAGQSVVMVAGLITLALTLLARRPRLAGVLFALAAALKPQAALLAPVALVACGGFEALGVAAIAGAALAGASIVLFGFARWPEWLASLGPFQGVIESVPRFQLGLVTPSALGRAIGLSGAALTVWIATFAIGGAAIVWRVFARADEAAERTGVRAAALAIGGLCASPYALCYDGTLVVPAAVALLVGAEAARWPSRLAAFCAACLVTAPGLGFAAIAAFGLLSRLDPAAARPGPARATA
jgi:hypothetical protein